MVLLRCSFLRLVKIISSVSVSTADKQSSKINSFGSRISALAILIRCFCPPLRFTPLSPKIVLNLSGKSSSNNNSSIKLNKLKTYVLSNYIIPLYSEQWDVLNKNIFLIDETIKKINNYYKTYKLDELQFILELLKIIKLVISKNELIFDLEDKTKRTLNKNNIINMVYKTTKIQILPEYEIYNSILGKPSKKEPYNGNIINDIKILIMKENITYDKIKDYIENKYTSC